eukprot:TRINITY_DN700_c0_g1_i1.p1 TRINITY_DN700_c0_g1~~TRINITY_DN700_c0_g1_i1.p1  ORF type:complete len:625 (-),score=73.26 TRINITY_DN700_c0_g1_i1:1864-3738(-)
MSMPFLAASFSDEDLSLDTWHVGATGSPTFKAFITRGGHLISSLHDLRLQTSSEEDGIFRCICSNPSGQLPLCSISVNERFTPFAEEALAENSDPSPPSLCNQVFFPQTILSAASASKRPLDAVEIGAECPRKVGEVYLVKILGTFQEASEEPNAVKVAKRLRKILCIAVEDPMARFVRDVKDVQALLPGDGISMLSTKQLWMKQPNSRGAGGAAASQPSSRTGAPLGGEGRYARASAGGAEAGRTAGSSGEATAAARTSGEDQPAGAEKDDTTATPQTEGVPATSRVEIKVDKASEPGTAKAATTMVKSAHSTWQLLYSDQAKSGAESTPPSCTKEETIRSIVLACAPPSRAPSSSSSGFSSASMDRTLASESGGTWVDSSEASELSFDSSAGPAGKNLLKKVSGQFRRMFIEVNAHPLTPVLLPQAKEKIKPKFQMSKVSASCPAIRPLGGEDDLTDDEDDEEEGDEGLKHRLSDSSQRPPKGRIFTRSKTQYDGHQTAAVSSTSSPLTPSSPTTAIVSPPSRAHVMTRMLRKLGSMKGSRAAVQDASAGAPTSLPGRAVTLPPEVLPSSAARPAMRSKTTPSNGTSPSLSALRPATRSLTPPLTGGRATRVAFAVQGSDDS